MSKLYLAKAKLAMSEKDIADAVSAGELIEIQEAVMKKYQSGALEVIHQDAEGLHRLGIISDKEMREYGSGLSCSGRRCAMSEGSPPGLQFNCN